MTDRNPGEAPEAAGRAEFVKGLAVFAAILGFVRLRLPALLPQRPGPAGRPSIHPPTRSVKRRG